MENRKREVEVLERWEYLLNPTSSLEHRLELGGWGRLPQIINL